VNVLSLFFESSIEGNNQEAIVDEE